jgi:LacI family transcriptional regulator
MPKVLLLSDFTSAYSRLLLKGFLDYSKEIGNWNFYRIPMRRDDLKDEGSIKTVIEIAKRWHADAILGQLSEINVRKLCSLKIPIVLQNYTNRVDGVSNITGDYYGTGELAANYFLRKGFKSFAFYGTVATIWSREREDGFRTKLAEMGQTVNVYNENNNIRYESTSNIKMLQIWLMQLPRPTALFACDDVFALRITEVCGMCGIQVPQDLAVLGVDNDEILCNMSDPPLSSIVLDVKNGGYQAARHLHTIIKEQTTTPFNITIKPIRIERRRSTEGYSVTDKLVKNALQLIENKENRLISVADILNRLCVSRRVLEIHFRKEIGMSVYQYILEFRTACFAEELLSSEKSIMEIAFQLGYEDYANLSKAFKRIYGVTPTQYRNFYKYGKEKY